LARRWFVEDGVAPSEIADLLGRDKSTITRLLVKRRVLKKQGRAPALTEDQKKGLVDRVRAMVEKADGKHHVTIAMVKTAARCKASVRTILEALHEHKVGSWMRAQRMK
jgi:IS30 family transposase